MKNAVIPPLVLALAALPTLAGAGPQANMYGCIELKSKPSTPYTVTFRTGGDGTQAMSST